MKAGPVASPTVQTIRLQYAMTGAAPEDRLDRVRRGDMAAATELVTALTPLVRRIVGANLPWRLDPDDLCQDVFVKVFGRLNQYAGGVPFEHWVARVALNTCRDHLRSEQRNREVRHADLDENQVAVLDAVAADQVETTPTDGVAARDLADQLLASLSSEDRLVVQMLDMEQRSAADVQAVTGWTITGIRVRAFRARRKLRKELERLKTTRK
jgi:RNA polymerase sigma-70 factor (ECF subfamily)